MRRATEKVAETTVEDLLTGMVGWGSPTSTTKWPGAKSSSPISTSADWSSRPSARAPSAGRMPWRAAFRQAQGYAETLRVGLAGVSDWALLVAAYLVPAGRRARATMDLSIEEVGGPDRVGLLRLAGAS